MRKKKGVIYQAGAVAVRSGASQNFEVLLVKAKKDPEYWIFPKGHIESRESADSAAERELLEEAGVRGKIVRQAGESEYRLYGRIYHVSYFLLKYLSTEGYGEPGRTPFWCTVNDALKLLSFPDSREVLKGMVPFIIHETINK
jgi:8-oxo-dGTP pyrophosphatase MutT (NUDIX family)